MRKGTYDAGRYRIVQQGDPFTSVLMVQQVSDTMARSEKSLFSTPQELAREQQRRSREPKPAP